MNELMAKLQILEEAKAKLIGKGRFLCVQDATMAALQDMQAQSPSGVIYNVDELTTIFKKISSEDSPDRSQILQMFDGGEQLDVARVSKGYNSIKSSTLSIVGGIQPSVLQKYVKEATDADLGRADGFLQRFQMMIIPQDGISEKINDVKTDTPDALNDLFTWIEDELPSKIIDDEWSPIVLKPSDEAYAFWLNWFKANKLKAYKYDKTKPYLASHIVKHRGLITGLSVVFAIIEKRDHIALADIEMAAGWCDYLELHAIKMYSLSDKKKKDGVDKLAEKILNGSIKDGETLSELGRRKILGRKSSASEILNALKDLEAKHWLKIEKHKNQKQVIRINPKLVIKTKGAK